MMDTTESELIEKGMRTLWLIWAAMLGSLCIYVFICHQFGDKIRVNGGSNLTIGTLKNILYLVVIVTLLITYFLRKFMLSGQFGQSASKIHNLTFPANPAPFLPRYTTALILSQALSESIGIYGLVLFLLGDSYQTLYTFIGISALAMFYYRPKTEEIEKLAMTMKSEQMNQHDYTVR